MNSFIRFGDGVHYIPSKPAKYGLKFWITADSASCYYLNVQMYCGASDRQPNQSLGENVVIQQTEFLQGSGRNLTTDNFFTSLKLADELRARNMTLVGTMRANKQEIPPHRNEVKSLALH